MQYEPESPSWGAERGLREVVIFGIRCGGRKGLSDLTGLAFSIRKPILERSREIDLSRCSSLPLL